MSYQSALLLSPSLDDLPDYDVISGDSAATGIAEGSLGDPELPPTELDPNLLI
jgi:hypothetical protein